MTSAPSSPQEEDWRQFRNVAAMANHWDRPGWTPGRAAYYWYLTFDSAQLRRLTGRCQNDLRLPYLDPVPLDRLHLTLPKVGWSDEVPRADVDAVAGSARAVCAALRPFPLTVGPLSGSRGAVRFSVSPWEPLLALRDGLAEAVRAVRGPTRVDADFRPHVGVAYCNRAVPAAPLVAKVAPLREIAPVDVTVSSVELVLLRRQEGAYTWSTLQTVALGEARQDRSADSR